MSVATVVTRGYGSFGDIAHIVTRGYDIGEPPALPFGRPATLLPGVRSVALGASVRAVDLLSKRRGSGALK